MENLENDLKLYQVVYRVQKDTNPDAFEGKREFRPELGNVFRIAKDHKNAIKSFEKYIAPQIISNLERQSWGNVPNWILDKNFPISVWSCRKVDSVQGYEIKVNKSKTKKK